MTDERVVETPSTHTTIIERRGGGGATTLLAVVLLLAVLLGGWYLFARQSGETAKNNAITSAAKSVGSAADKAGDAITPDKK